MKKMLVFDLDDTLLTSKKTITPCSVQAIRACKAKGMFIGYITARMRPFKDEIFFIEKYNLPCDFIAYYNGAEIYVGDTSIESNVIAYDNAMKIIRGLNKLYPNARISVIHEPWSYATSSGENWNIYTREKIKCSILELSRYDVQRIIVRFDKDDNKNKLSDFMTEESIFFVNADGSAMIINKNATKENALKKAAEYFDIKLCDIIAFGDDVNDANMLNIAGIGVAVNNAVDTVKKTADYITETNDNEGISLWINKYLLNKK